MRERQEQHDDGNEGGEKVDQEVGPFDQREEMKREGEKDVMTERKRERRKSEYFFLEDGYKEESEGRDR